MNARPAHYHRHRITCSRRYRNADRLSHAASNSQAAKAADHADLRHDHGRYHGSRTRPLRTSITNRRGARMTQRSNQPLGGAERACQIIIEPGIEEAQALAGAGEDDRWMTHQDAVPLLGLERAEIEKAGENASASEDSNRSARRCPLLGTSTSQHAESLEKSSARRSSKLVCYGIGSPESPQRPEISSETVRATATERNSASRTFVLCKLH